MEDGRWMMDDGRWLMYDVEKQGLNQF